MSPRDRHRRLAVAAAVAAVIALTPIWLDPIATSAMTRGVALAVGVLGLNLVTGYGGQISLGHGAFLGLGAYSLAILVGDHGWSYFAALPAAGLICFVVGLGIGVPALRIRGLYLALVTLLVAAAFPVVIAELDSITGGFSGKPVRAELAAPGWFPGDDQLWRHLVVVAFAAAVFVLVANVLVARVGRAIRAVREDETAAAASGVDVTRWRLVTFGLSAAVTGVGGALLVMERPFVGLTDFSLDLSLRLYAAMVIGGAGTVAGPVLGGALLALLPYLEAEHGIGTSSGLVEGLALVVMTLLVPTGIAGLLRRRPRRLRLPV